MVVVNRRYDIQAINGVTRRLLGIYSTAIGDDLIHIARGIPHRQLREVIDRAFRTGGPTSLESFTVAEPLIEERSSTLQMTCYPQRSDDEHGPPQQVLIVVNDVTDALAGGAAGADQGESGADAPAADPAIRIQQQDQLIARLLETNRQLLEANQEILGTNEELRTANEGFLLTAEEAQASTEEIETLNEEMQATNEELETLNEELQATVEELNTTNEELHARSIEAQEAAQVSEEARARLAVILNTMGDALLVLNLDGTTPLTNAPMSAYSPTRTRCAMRGTRMVAGWRAATHRRSGRSRARPSTWSSSSRKVGCPAGSRRTANRSATPRGDSNRRSSSSATSPSGACTACRSSSCRWRVTSCAHRSPA
ncbi:MAG: Chemotaxis protein methyltransferase CheR [uncultured Thermomicrobiales bacterium]|uniref:Chemotaxis protein methyltransferase CheR n=1 Tax=uncultured Thermomicrobiales bacterium TaxID=1645740 RepID=A0A6J4V1Y6_9BACT|nr:MAG: Chemotaxis protein methyltransferase CheR [uncultured Thermomicrobiales bacterium]